MGFQHTILAAALALASSLASAGPIGTYYVADTESLGGSGQYFAYRDSEAWTTPMQGPSEGPFAIYHDAVYTDWQDQHWGLRSIGYMPSANTLESTGHGYSNVPGSLQPLPAQYQNTAPDDWYLDGTGDAQYNYTIGMGLGNLVRFDLNWSNPQVLFTNTSDYWYGITYDKRNDSFWLYGDTGLLTNISKTGTTLASYDLSGQLDTTDLRGLAMDKDNSLWLIGRYSSGKLYHLNTTGTVLGTEFTSLAPFSPLGGEIATIPEPSSLALMALGGLALVARRWRRPCGP